MTPSRPSQPPHALFVQATDPAAYPPLIHAAGILAEAGWSVTFLSAPAADRALVLPSHPAIHEVRISERPSHVMGRGHFLEYCSTAVKVARRLKPAVVYASDPLGALPGWMCATVSGSRLVYHEHDSPTPGMKLNPVLSAARRLVARKADLVVFPNAERARIAEAALGYRTDRLHIVWNTPRLSEAPPVGALPDDPMILYYHGSITPERLPESVIDAVARFNGRIRLGVAGYEAPGAIGYVGRLQARAGDADGAPIVRYAGRIPAHEMLLRHASESHVGLSLMPLDSSDVNMRHMTGASNKAFDYLSVGLPLLVSDLPDWRRFYVTPGFGLACDPGDPASIERALAWFVEHPEERRDMGAAGRRKVVESWNYEAQFQPVFRALEAFA